MDGTRDVTVLVVQFAPRIQPEVAELHLFQRTAQRLLRGDWSSMDVRAEDYAGRPEKAGTA
ncbi:hypothetical protein [Amycolatopsis nigrescens]|uniref:hypothetical protein n=1 Tax=Amycolatopsis nigrescens TaxID=381445 RepID=UPI000373E6C8|nr:hypothetical protein [Amycolatopsis nigrescens]